MLSKHRAQYTKLKVIIRSTNVSNIALIYGTVFMKTIAVRRTPLNLKVNDEHHGATRERR